jgi:hypothetical protein
MNEIENEIDLQEFLSTFRQAMRPLNMCLALVARRGSSDLMHDVCKVVTGVLVEARQQFMDYQHRGRGGLQ